MKGYWTTLNHFKLVKHVLLNNNKIEMNKIYMTDNNKLEELSFHD